MRRTAKTSLKVCLNGRHIGIWSKLTGGGVTFQYADKWLGWNKAIPISQSMPLQEKAYTGVAVSRYFENLLPDSDPILRRIADRVGADGRDAYSLLAEIGRDCVGALQFLPMGMDIPDLAPPLGRKLSSKEIYNTLMNLERAPLGIEAEGGFRISLAGAQEKAAFLEINKNWYEPKGLSPTTHIFKPAIGTIHWETGPVDMTDSVENEFYCLKLLKAFGLETADIEILNFEEKKVLAVKRFDRIHLNDGVILRRPQEDMCQALGFAPSQKYQNMGGPTLVDILKFLSASETPHKDQQTVFKCQILFWLIGAIDGHAKNFSIFLAPNDGFQLTPLYDVMSAQIAMQANQIRHKDYKLAMPLGHSKHYKIKNIRGRHFVETAIDAELGKDFAREAIVQIQDWFEPAFEKVLADLPIDFPMQIHACIKAAGEKRLPLLASAFE